MCLFLKQSDIPLETSFPSLPPLVVQLYMTLIADAIATGLRL